MEEEIRDITESEKANYLKYIGIIYVGIGLAYFIYSIVMTITGENNFIYLITDIIILSTTIYLYFINTIIYEIHTMSKFTSSKILKKYENNDFAEDSTEQDNYTVNEENEDNSEKLERLINNLTKSK